LIFFASVQEWLRRCDVCMENFSKDKMMTVHEISYITSLEKTILDKL
jgi:hypothetical protein